jgi:hypothetical protein
MLKLRRATVVETRSAGEHTGVHDRPGDEREQRLVIALSGDGELAGDRREAIAEVALVGRCEVGDEVIVNTLALDLRLGSGGFDIVHVNLTRGLRAGGAESARAMKLNYTSLQHAVEPVEEATLQLPVERPVAVLALHGQLAPVAWAFAQAAPGARPGYVQSSGGALPGGHSRTVRMLRERGLLAGHVSAGAAFGGEAEAITTAGALHHGLRALGWDAAVCGPGPGIVGSGTALGHGGMVALDSAHVALALGCPTLLVARMSSGEQRSRHRGLSHHSLTVLDLLLAPVTVALPAGVRSPVGADLRAGLSAVFSMRGRGDGASASEPDGQSQPTLFAAETDEEAHAKADGNGKRPALALEDRPITQRPARIARHDWRRARVDLPGYAGSGLPAQTMGRPLVSDPLFFAAALAGGSVLAELRAEARAAEPVGGETPEGDRA